MKCLGFRDFLTRQNYSDQNWPAWFPDGKMVLSKVG